MTVIRGGRQGIITVRLGDQATRMERAAAQQLGPAYANYLMLQVCAEQLPQFDRARADLRAFLKTREPFSHELTDELWNTVAAHFQKHEGDLKSASNEQLAAECEGASKQARFDRHRSDDPVTKKNF